MDPQALLGRYRDHLVRSNRTWNAETEQYDGSPVWDTLSTLVGGDPTKIHEKGTQSRLSSEARKRLDSSPYASFLKLDRNDPNLSIQQIQAAEGAHLKSEQERLRGERQEDVTASQKPIMTQLANASEVNKGTLQENRDARIASNSLSEQLMLQNSLDKANDNKTALQIAKIDQEGKLAAYEHDMEMWDKDRTRETYGNLGVALASLATVLAS